MADTFFDQLLKWQREIERLPPTPRALLMNHSVPTGKAFRQWDTKGDLWVWVNPSVLDEVGHVAASRSPFDLAPPWGIPIRHG